VEDGGSHRPRLHALPLATRNNAEEDFQFTEEVRFASAKAAPITLTEHVTMKWQAGVVLFTQSYTQDAVNKLLALRAVAVPRFSGQPAFAAVGARRSRRPASTARPRGPSPATLDLIAGARGIASTSRPTSTPFTSPAIAPAQAVNTANDFSDVSPQFALAYRVAPGRDALCLRLSRVQGGRFQFRVTAGRRVVRRGAQLELRRRREDLVPGSPLADRRGVPDRLARPAGERAESAGARPVFHCQRRGRRRARDWSSK